MKADWIKARQTKYSAYVTVYILVIIAALGVANFLANRYDKSYDSTANKQFSLSEQTVKAVKGLKNNVNVSYFGETTNFPQARDLLGRYAALSPHFKVDYIDPVKKPQLARAAGVRQEGTIVVDTGARKEDAKSLSEEEITGALIRALKGGERNACFLAGSEERSLDESSGSGLSLLKEGLEHNNYKTRTVNLSQTSATPGAAPTGLGATPAMGQVQPAKVEIPKDCSVLVSAGPKLAYSAAEVDAIKNYVENGGSALFLMDTPLRIGAQEGSENPELTKLLASWGVTMNADLALDTSGIGQIFGLGPEVAMVTNYESQPIVRDFKEGVPTAIPLSRTLKIEGNTKVTVDKLISTGDNSFATTNVTGRIDPSKGVKGPLVLAAAGTYNTGKPGGNGRFVVFGSSMWAANNFLGSRQIANRDLALNSFNWLTSDEDLISIRPKEPEDRRLNISGNRMNMIFWWSVVLLPLTVVGAGLMVWWRRR
ncbi:MAG TPA: GldG family protein [Bryobacteraceae bacterium]|nr:GldG family protein [Bryobacteraceae bacterium]